MAVKQPVEAVETELRKLNQHELEKLQQLKDKIQDLLYPDGDTSQSPAFDDIMLVRFLRARNWKSSKAEIMLRQMLKFMDENEFESEVLLYKPSPLYSNYYPHGHYGYDKEGNMVHYEPLGSIDPKSLMRGLHRDEILLNEFMLGLMTLTICSKMSKMQKRPVTQCTIVYDLEGLSMKHFYKPFVSVYSDLCMMFENMFPECLSKLIILNAPRIFPMAFAIIKPLLSENTRSKFIFGTCDKEQNYKLLSTYIEERWIPEIYLGPVSNSIAKIVYGNVVPDSEQPDVMEALKGAEKLQLNRGEKQTLTIGRAEEGQALRYVVFGEDFNDVLLHFDTDNEEATRRFRKADCSLMPKKGLYTVRKSGQLRVTFENDSLLRTRTILYKFDIVDLPEKSDYFESIIAHWEHLHIPAATPVTQMRSKPAKASVKRAAGQEGRPNSYVEAANEAHAADVNSNGVVNAVLGTQDPVQLTPL